MSSAGAVDRVLWVTEESPDRSLGGGSIRQAHLFEALARAVPTDLLLAGSLLDARVRAAAGEVIELPRRTAPWSTHPVLRRALQLGITFTSPLPSAAYPAGPNRRALARALRRRARGYAVVCVEHEALVPVARALGEIPAVVTFHHVISEMVRQELAHTPGSRQRWYLERDLAKARRLEQRALGAYRRVLTCSETDAAALRRIGGTATAGKVRVIPNGVDLTALHPTPVPAEPCVLFPGSFAYAPNVDGALWFCAEVWPRVRRAVPAARLVLAGRDPAPEVVALGAQPGVEVLANVPSMVDHFQAARAVAVPLRVGTGTRLKALEAMAAGRPVIGTMVGLDGIGVLDRVHVRVADDPEAMAAAIVEVLVDDEVAARLGEAARRHVEGRFGWDRIGAQLVATVTELLDASAQPPAPGVAGRGVQAQS